MNDQKLYGLTDFRDLRKKHEDFNTITSKQSNSSNLDLDFENNEQIMKSFKELREKLKLANKQNHNLRQQINKNQIQLKQLHESECNLMSINQQIKQKNNLVQQSNEELKKRLLILKQSQSQKAGLEQQLQFLKGNLMEMKIKNDKLEEQKKRIIEFSIEDKMNLEEKINLAHLQKSSNEKYITNIENDLSKSKETIFKLQNEIKKIEIKFDEEVFSKQWSKDNFQKDHYQKQIKQLNNQIAQLRNKNRKEKEKRADLQQRVLELEEITGLWTVKAEAYEGEVQIINKKCKKMQRRMSQAKTTANKMINEKVNWQQKFIKCVLIADELITRVKRDLMGDVVDLAKTCEFKISKLKQNDKQLSKLTSRETNSIGKKYKTYKKQNKSIEKQTDTIKSTNTQKKLNFDSQKLGCISENDINTKFSEKPKQKPMFYNTTESIEEKENQNNIENEYHNIENKIRKEREQMQRKLKQRMLFRKIEVSCSPQKTKLREDYLRLIFQK